MTRIENALKALNPKAQFAVYGDGTIDWLSPDIEQPSEEQIQAKLAELQAEYDSKQYQRDRAVAYDPIPEQLDQIYHDIDGWKARIKSVKDKFPKS